jgi:hypothetical protein
MRSICVADASLARALREHGKHDPHVFDLEAAILLLDSFAVQEK